MFLNKSNPRYLEYTSAAVPTISNLEPQTLSMEDSEKGRQILTPNLRATYLKFSNKLKTNWVLLRGRSTQKPGQI